MTEAAHERWRVLVYAENVTVTLVRRDGTTRQEIAGGWSISIARKEANETQYWLELARRVELMPAETYTALAEEAAELTKILGTIVRKTQEHIRASKSK